jgi:hypothetical protein
MTNKLGRRYPEVLAPRANEGVLRGNRLSIVITEANDQVIRR